MPDVPLTHNPLNGHGAALTIDDVEVAARALGRAQAACDLSAEEWFSRRFLRAYSGSRLVNWALMDDDSAWAQPLVREHFSPSLRKSLGLLHVQRDHLLATMEGLPRTVCHLDVLPNNLIRRPDGEMVFLDWAFVGDGALGEDIGNLIPDSVIDLLLPHDRLDDLDTTR